MVNKKPRYPLFTIIRSLMFSYGDTEQPLECCQEFLLNVIRSQLQMLLTKASDLAKQRRNESIGYSEFVFAFRHHPTLLRRLIFYMRMTDVMPGLVGSCQPEIPSAAFNNEGNEEGSNNRLYESTSNPLEIKSKNAKGIINAVREIDVLGHLLDGIENKNTKDWNWIDTTRMERIRQMAHRTSQMDANLYHKFNEIIMEYRGKGLPIEARQMSFCSNLGSKSPKFCQWFLEWLQAPPLSSTPLIYALNFCATEILAILVESALLHRSEEKMATAAEIGDTTTNIHFNESPLQLRHYQEALRRNRGYAKRKNILFGNF